MKKTEKYLVFAVVGYFVYKKYFFAGSPTQSSSAFVAAGGNPSNWTITVDPFAGATAAVPAS
jgi:hypothetical protein